MLTHDCHGRKNGTCQPYDGKVRRFLTEAGGAQVSALSMSGGNQPQGGGLAAEQASAVGSVLHRRYRTVVLAMTSNPGCRAAVALDLQPGSGVATSTLLALGRTTTVWPSLLKPR